MWFPIKLKEMPKSENKIVNYPNILFCVLLSSYKAMLHITQFLVLCCRRVFSILQKVTNKYTELRSSNSIPNLIFEATKYTLLYSN